MVSVIIPSYNSGKTITAVLQALQNQTFTGEYEIILVDSSKDRTPEIVRQNFPAIKFFHFEKKTDPGTARNKGLEMSGGDPILFIDSDCTASNDWLEKMTAAHKQFDYEAIGGAVENGNNPDNNIAWAGYIAEFREFLPGQAPRLTEHIPTCNISYKRRVFEKELFNPHYYPQEDLEFNYRLRQAGGRIYFDPSIRIYHRHRETLRAFFSHQKKIGRITARMLKILPLQGAKIARNRLLALLSIPILPAVKWIKTAFVFIRINPKLVGTRPLGFVIFALGLFPWISGFILGVFRESE